MTIYWVDCTYCHRPICLTSEPDDDLLITVGHTKCMQKYINKIEAGNHSDLEKMKELTK
jgi:hypothetical protein